MKITKHDVFNISDRAKGVRAGGVLPDEVEYARSILRGGVGEIHAAIYIVGLCGNGDDKYLLEKYLYGSENDAYAELALKAICRYLGQIGDYRPLIRELIMSPLKDSSGRRMAAIHLADKYFENFFDDELGCEIVRIFCDLNDPDRIAARAALVDVLGIQEKIADPYGLLSVEIDVDATYIVKLAFEYFHRGLQ
jgi:hypothetical protein